MVPDSARLADHRGDFELAIPVADAAAARGYSPDTLRLWIREGLLKAERRTVRNMRVKLSDVDRVIAAKAGSK